MPNARCGWRWHWSRPSGRSEPYAPLAAHIGIATGEVVVGGRASGFEGAERAVGKAPNLAARLQKSAKASQVVICPVTRTLVRDAFELTDLGVLPIAGIGPTRAWAVDAVRRADGGASMPPRRRPTERDGRAHRGSRAAAARVAAHRGRVQASGVDRRRRGIGKSRLTECCANARRRSACHAALPLLAHPRICGTASDEIAQLELAAGSLATIASSRNRQAGKRARRSRRRPRGGRAAAGGAAVAAAAATATRSLGAGQRQRTLDALLGQWRRWRSFIRC